MTHLFGKELFIRFSASAFRKLPSIYVFSYFPFGFEGRMWDLIVSVPDHCLSFYFDPICPKTLCSLAPTPMMLHITFDQDWPTGLRDIQTEKALQALSSQMCDTGQNEKKRLLLRKSTAQ